MTFAVLRSTSPKRDACVQRQKGLIVRLRAAGVNTLDAQRILWLAVSTYVAARLYHRTINNPGQRTIIVAHSRPASGNLYQIVKRFHDNMPSDMKPSVGVSNATELIFDRIDSGYSITVASDEGTGRSATAQAIHCSEIAFWPSVQTQLASHNPASFRSWPPIPIRVIASANDRFFPLEFQRRLARVRLGTDIRVISGGHLVALSNPDGVVEQILGFERECV